MIYFILNSFIISYEEAVFGSISMLLYTVSTDEMRAEQSIGEDREGEICVYRAMINTSYLILLFTLKEGDLYAFICTLLWVVSTDIMIARERIGDKRRGKKDRCDLFLYIK